MSVIDRSKAGYLDVDTDTMEENPEIVKAIFGQCLVMGSLTNVFDNTVRYLLVCDEFETITADEPIPDYQIGVEDDVISFTRIA